MSSPAPSSVSPGQVFGKYVIKRVMAEGGMATVYEANHQRLGHRVAIKILARHLLAKRDIVERFEREARAAARIESPHVVRVVDVDVSDEGRPYIVMEYLEGRDLEAELRERGQLAIGDAIAYILEASAAVSVAHKVGVVHRDLKPANIFLAQEGGRRTVKVLDFGISKVTSANEVSATSTQTMLGTPLYMSPEQVRSARDVDGRADIWSLGVVLYEALSGQLPFLREDASGVIAAIVADPITPIGQLRPDLPPALAAVIMKALEKDRTQRFRLIDDFAAALIPFAPGWFRPPKAITVPPFAARGALPPELMHSLSDGIDSERTVADPNMAPDALRPLAPVQNVAAYAPTPAHVFMPSQTQTPEPSQPSAVARTTAGGDKKLALQDNRQRTILLVALGVIAVCMVIFVGLYLRNSSPQQATPRTPPQLPEVPSAPPVAGRGTLVVTKADGICSVSIDGASVGSTMYSQPVASGTHEISCASGTDVRKQTIQVVAGQTARVNF
jgi:serine/threonine protein kinase